MALAIISQFAHKYGRPETEVEILWTRALSLSSGHPAKAVMVLKNLLAKSKSDTPTAQDYVSESSRPWDDWTYEEQVAYLKKYKGSKRVLTAKPRGKKSAPVKSKRAKPSNSTSPVVPSGGGSQPVVPPKNKRKPRVKRSFLKQAAYNWWRKAVRSTKGQRASLVRGGRAFKRVISGAGRKGDGESITKAASLFVAPLLAVAFLAGAPFAMDYVADWSNHVNSLSTSSDTSETDKHPRTDMNYAKAMLDSFTEWMEQQDLEKLAEQYKARNAQRAIDLAEKQSMEGLS